MAGGLAEAPGRRGPTKPQPALAGKWSLGWRPVRRQTNPRVPGGKRAWTGVPDTAPLRTE
jgi:hypothetical protein